METIESKFEDLIKKYSNELFRYIYALTRDYHLAEDILQDTFYKAYANLVNLNDISNLKSWLFRIARNNFIDYCRKNNKVSIYEDTYFNSIKVDPSSEPEEVLLSCFNHQLIDNHLSTIGEKYKQAIILVDFRGFSYKEAAEKMNVKINYLKSLVFRGRKELKQKLSNEGE